MDPSIRDRHPAFRLKDALRRSMQRYSEPHNRFVTGSIIERVWAGDPDTLRDQLGLSSFSDEDLSYIDQNLRRVTCIFAWIGVDNFAHNLRRLLPVQQNGQNSRSGQKEVLLDDDHLPLRKEKCYDLFGEDLGQDFFDNQFLFKVIAINQFGNGVVEQWPESRFPFTGIPKPLASGAYGDVFEVTIVKGQLRPAPNESNYDDRKVAMKKVRQARDWVNEVRGLDFLRESIAKHDRLTLHLAAMVQGDDFYLFLPLAQLGDLELFLQEGRRPGEDDRDEIVYDFNRFFPNVTLKDLIHEFSTLTGAIDFLHNRVSSRRNVPVYCAHVDLRPRNVLVFPPDASNPAGVWKISDFGISSFRYSDGRRLNEPAWTQFPSIGDVAASRWYQPSTTSSLPSLQGPHRAPELRIHGYPLLMPATDIWALGCILCEVLIFGTGENQPGQRRERLNAFRYQRRIESEETDAFHEKSYQSLESFRLSPEERGQLTFQLRPRVRQWLDNIADVPHCNNIIPIILCMLHPNPTKRLKSDQIFNLMREICSSSSSRGPRILEEDASLRTAKWSIAIRRDRDTFAYEHEMEPETSPRPGFRLMSTAGRSMSTSPTSSVGTSPSRSRSRTPSWADTIKSNENRFSKADTSISSIGDAKAMKPYDPRLAYRDPETSSVTSSGSHRDRLEPPVYPVPTRPRPSVNSNTAVSIFRANLQQEQPAFSPIETVGDKTEPDAEVKPDNTEPFPEMTKMFKIMKRDPFSAAVNLSSRRVNIPFGEDSLIYLRKTKIVQEKSKFKTKYKEIFEIRIRKRHDPSDPSKWHDLPMAEGVDWSEMSVRSNVAAVLGTDKDQAGVSDLCLFDLETMSSIDLPLERQEISQLQKVSCSYGQQLAFCKAKEIILWRRGADTKRLPNRSETNSPRELVNAQFSHDAGFFFAWWRSSSGDVVQIWDLKGSTNPGLRAEFTISRVSSRIHNSFIIPCGNLPGCILRDSQGVVRTALALQPSRKRLKAEKQEHLSEWGFPSMRSLCCATDVQLFFIDNSSKIRCHRLTVSKEQSLLLVEKDSMFGNEKCPLNDPTAIALQKHPLIPENRLLRIANLSGAVHELELSEYQSSLES